MAGLRIGIGRFGQIRCEQLIKRIVGAATDNDPKVDSNLTFCSWQTLYMRNQSHKLPSFEGLRGIAAFIVVIFHLHLAFYVDSASAIRRSLDFLPWAVRGVVC